MFARLFGRLRRRRQREDPWLDLPWEDKPEDMPDGTTNRARLGHRFRDGMDTISVEQRRVIDEEDARVARFVGTRPPRLVGTRPPRQPFSEPRLR